MTPLTPRTIDAADKARRGLWHLARLLLFRPTPVPLHAWRAALLRLFGARIGADVKVYPSTRIWAPWNLDMGDASVLGPEVECYCVAPVRLHAHAVVSQFSHLCTASHDYTRRSHPLVAAPIVLGEGAWVTTDVFVAPGVTIGERAVVLARSTVLGDVPPGRVWGGYPARDLGERRWIDDGPPA